MDGAFQDILVSYDQSVDLEAVVSTVGQHTTIHPQERPTAFTVGRSIHEWVEY